MQHPTAQASHEKSPHTLVSYLLLPRPDGMSRAIITLIGWAVANILTGWQSWREGLVLAIAFDLLVYQARYQWNDIQGKVGDLLSPMAADRARLPQARQATLISLATIVLRLCLALAICLAPLPRDTWSLSVSYFGMSVGAVIVLTIAYEYVRQRQRQTQKCSHASFALIITLISLGFPLRFAVGFLVTAPSLQFAETTPFIGYLAAFALAGTMSVTMGWLLEAASYGNVDASRKTITALNSKILRAKPHIYKNWLYAGFEGNLQDEAPMNGASMFVLKKAKMHIWRIWNLSYFLGIFLSVVSVIATKQRITEWPVLAAICLGALVLFELLVRVSSGGKAIAASTLLMLYFTWLATGHQLSQLAGTAALVGLAWMSFYFVFYEMNYSYSLHGALYAKAILEAIRRYSKKRYLGMPNSLRAFEPSRADK